MEILHHGRCPSGFRTLLFTCHYGSFLFALKLIFLHEFSLDPFHSFSYAKFTPYFLPSYFYPHLTFVLTALPMAYNGPLVPPPIPAVQNAAPVVADPLMPSRKCLAHIPGLVGTNTAFIAPDHIRKKFINRWNVHISLTYLTDKGCLLKDRLTTSSSQDVLTIDNSSGHILTTSKPLSDDGELDLTFNKWHQAWRWLLDLIKSLIPEEFLLWEQHYLFILNNENHTELWPLYLAYDSEIHKRATQLPINPSKFSIGIWNDLEASGKVEMGPEQVAGSRERSGWVWFYSTSVYRMCLLGHVTGRSRPTVPSGPLSLTMSSLSEHKATNK